MARKKKEEYEELKAQAYDYYVRHKMTFTAIADILGLNDRTISDWCEKGDWKSDKTAYSMSRKELLKEAYAKMADINKQIKTSLSKNEVPDKTLTDYQATVLKEIKQYEVFDLSSYIEIGNEFISYTAKVSPEKAKEYSKHFLDFVHYKKDSSE